MTAALAPPEAPPTIVDLLERWARAAWDDEDLVTRALRDRALLLPLRDFASRRSKRIRAWLVDLGYRLAGGAGACPEDLPLLVEALHAGSLIVDDIEDGSDERRGAAALHKLYGVPVALNAGNWLYFWPQVLLSRMPLPDAARLCAHERIARCLLRCHEGQALDLTVRVWDLPRSEVSAVVRAITERKTAGLLALASALGAIAAAAAPARVDAVGRFGHEIGVALQMLDDLSGVCEAARRHKGVEDLACGRATWIWAWLSEDVDGETYRALVERLRAGGAGASGFVEEVRSKLGDGGLPRARAQLRGAIDAARVAGGDERRCDEIALELSRLERSYVAS